MADTVFLLPHPDCPAPWVRSVAVAVQAPDGAAGWRLSWRVQAAPGRLRLPAPGGTGRADGLWRHTCFELFAAGEGDAYREFNFSPSGQWQAYDFTAYRQGGTVAALRADPRPRWQAVPDGLRLSVRLAAADLPRAPWLGPCAVLQDALGDLSYWAPVHGPGRPDFHAAAVRCRRWVGR